MLAAHRDVRLRVTISRTSDYFGPRALDSATALLGERDDTDGRVWHLPSDQAVTGREFISMVADALGRPLRPTATSPAMVKLAGVFVPMIREINEGIGQWTQPFVCDWSNFERTLGPFEVTPNVAAIRDTVRWYQERGAAEAA